ncbi:hypothetical protein WR25_06705 [Diploscapter pachys]|uniref:Dol-P-Glc:Glc(2)Man(9)GlcNAc(2)-PP-Dol alpha-1,2-glucosyltransferase n=1 Tax=Diploscapter pachys TaxID=2018661 RepID=A0A2A2K0S0_9BILA|nr:hypothetical protein WR25_06705 [Diploscapter pachys]
MKKQSDTGRCLSRRGDVALAILISSLHAFVVSLVYKIAPEPYMDEIFHVNQTRTYCEGNLAWNPKITTPPALYLISMPFCGFERYANSVILFFATLAFCRYRRMFCRDCVHLTVLVSLCLPVLLHSSLLFYTDLLSISAVVAGFTFKNSFVSSIFFTLSVFTRQTNILWAGLYAANRLFYGIEKERPISSAIKGLLPLTPFIGMAAGFVGFVYWNGGIVLGDASAHQPQLHLAQLFYLGLFMALHAWPQALVDAGRIIRHDVLSLSTALLVPLSAVSINYFAFDHPYLLADNRHISSIIWRRLLGPVQLRQLLVPFYVASFLFLRRSTSHSSPIERFLFVLCCAASVVPAHLLEFRYFIIPFVLWRLTLTTKYSWLIVAELISNLAIFSAVFYLFLEKPFEWSNEPGVQQRYMW